MTSLQARQAGFEMYLNKTQAATESIGEDSFSVYQVNPKVEAMVASEPSDLWGERKNLIPTGSVFSGNFLLRDYGLFRYYYFHEKIPVAF